jgi:polyvinyl alcohol dehydrogenase (cytochrome)
VTIRVRSLAFCLLATGALFPVLASTGVPGVTVNQAGAAVAHFSFGSDWPVYHHDGLGSGLDPTDTDLLPAKRAWNATLDGQVFGEPLVEAGRVVVATENDTVYELAANSGAVLWSTHLGTPVPSSDLPCGDIGPTVGITGTPVIDPGRSEIFVVADEDVGGAVNHYLVGLDLYSGAMLLRQPVDPSGATPVNELQRTGLALDDGQVVFGMGGNFGDCGQYWGYVIEVPETGGTEHTYQVDAVPGNHAGAIWMGGAAPIVDNSGDIWVASGNGFGSNAAPGNPSDSSDSVLELSSSLQLLSSFTPSTWQNDNNHDFDLGSSAPALLTNGAAFQAGKSQTGYVLNASHLGGVGGQTATLQAGSFCGNDVDGGNAVNGEVVYVPCTAGVEAVQVSSDTSAGVLWQTSSGAGGPPVLAGGQVWTIGGSTLYGLSAANGSVVQSFSLSGEANHFPTPAVADGLLLAPESDGVAAFDGPDGLPPAPPPPPPRPGYWLAARDGGVFSFNTNFQGSVPGLRIHIGNIVGMAYDAATGGYWLVGSDGGVFAFNAPYEGSVPGLHIHIDDVVGMAYDAATGGYWLVGRDGGVFSFNAPYEGSVPGLHIHIANVVGMASDSATGGYWLVGSDGGVFAFNAPFAGSLGGLTLDQPVVALAAPPPP